MNKTSQYLSIAPSVQSALAAGKPVVALESTIIFHGMPYPRNLECAARCEQIVRENGAVPATIAIVEGQIRVGISDGEIRQLLDADDVEKVSRRDLARVVAEKKNGATTVAATMIIAQMAGIRVFATGGIGGVHRGAEHSFDISADLTELSQTDVCVVCAGAKSILDIGLTLEYLETLGVPVMGYQTTDFPAFYTPRSGYSTDYSVPDTATVARMLKAKWGMNLRGGALLACPVPAAHAMDEKAIDAAIAEALAEAKAQGITGKRTTPFLLGKVVEATGGQSLETNMQLVWNNCAIAARLAVDYANLG